mmetsp:Transcript_11362/g.26215  ORF Transcript_11362/g.26215 Transcript_11362/m.26215 type:complete len:432 (+) Transcript_11362:115-1410(+)
MLNAEMAVPPLDGTGGTTGSLQETLLSSQCHPTKQAETATPEDPTLHVAGALLLPCTPTAASSAKPFPSIMPIDSDTVWHKLVEHEPPEGSRGSNVGWCCCSWSRSCRWFQCCGVVCILAAAMIGLRLLIIHQSRPAGIACEQCAQAYFLRTACAFGGQELPSPTGDAAAWQQVFQVLSKSQDARRQIDALIGSSSFLEKASCPRWAKWNSLSKTCSESTSVKPSQCPRDPDVNVTRMIKWGLYPGYQCGVNFYRRSDASLLGGMCTCPNGEEYEVSDNNDGCRSLACEGGTPSSCSMMAGLSKNPHRTTQGRSVTCQPNFAKAAQLNGVAALLDADPSVDAACWPSRSEPAFAKEHFITTTCPNFRHRVRVPNLRQFAFDGMTMRTNMNPLAPEYGGFQVFYTMFYNTPAGDMCQNAFGTDRIGGPLLKL